MKKFLINIFAIFIPTKKLRHQFRDKFKNKNEIPMINKKYDIAIVGIATHFNYGSCLTNFATYNIFKDLGQSVCVITQPYSSVQKPYRNIFEKFPYPYGDIFTAQNKKDMLYFNQLSDIFCVTSDQLFNQNSYDWFDKFMLLDWVYDYKKKCAYAASFGHDKLLQHTREFARAEMSYFMKKFDIFTLREQSGVKLAEDEFGVKGEFVLDPVFLCNPKHFIDFAGDNNIEDNLFAYILDAQIDDILRDISNIKNIPIHKFNDYEKDLKANRNTNSLESWLRSLINSKFVITDSFHGLCFALIFKKDFIVFANYGRGINRFKSILNMVGLEDRMIESLEEYNNRKEQLLKHIDYDIVYEKMFPIIEKSKKFLEDIIAPLKKKKSLSDYDIIIQNRLSK